LIADAPPELVTGAIRRAGKDNPLLGIATESQRGQRGPMTTAAATDLGAAVGRWLGTREARVAASLVVLGYSARLVGPAVAVPLRDGILPDLRPSRVEFSFQPDRGFRLALPEPAGWRGDPSDLRRRWCDVIVDDHLTGVVTAVRAVVPVAAGLLWGNVASGLAGALRSLAASGAVPADRCHAEGLALLDHGPLRGSGRLDGDLSFRRRSCCLYYRLDGGGFCGDCPLPPHSGA
jgi:ferric iron reductase protein FhuF